MKWHAAIRETPGGVVLDVEVVPGSSVSAFPTGFNEWRGRLEAKVRAPPEDGKANAELCAIVAEALGVPLVSVRVTSGHTSRRKSIGVSGITEAHARERLDGILDRSR